MTKEEAIKHLHTYSSTNGSGLTTQDQHEEAKKMAIKALETQLQWIPCKTRKPEKSGLYLVTKQQKTGEIQLATAHYNTAFDEWSGNGNFKKVLAWQPLPLPWKGGQDGD